MRLGYGNPLISDRLEDHQGPLAAFTAALQAIDTPDMVAPLVENDDHALPENG